MNLEHWPPDLDDEDGVDEREADQIRGRPDGGQGTSLAVVAPVRVGSVLSVGLPLIGPPRIGCVKEIR